MLYNLLNNTNFVLAVILLAILGIVCLAGIIFALVRWKRHRAVSIITIISLLLTVVSAAIITVSRFYVIETQTSRIIESGGGMDKYVDLSLTYYQTFNLFFLLSNIIQPLLLIFFLAAIFLGRAKDGQKEQLNTFQKSKIPND